MDVSFFTSILLLWFVLCLSVSVLARWCANRLPSSTTDIPTGELAEPSPSGESLSAARLAMVLIGLAAPVATVGFAADGEPTPVQLISAAALAGAFLSGLAHATRRGALNADAGPER